MNLNLKKTALLSVLAGLSLNAYADGVVVASVTAPEQAIGGGLSAHDIMSAVVNRPEGDGHQATIKLHLVDGKGKESQRSAKLFRRFTPTSKEVALYFTAPASLKDSALLVLDRNEPETDDQYLYMPVMRKVRRIPSASRGDGFLGTDFSVEDVKNFAKINLDDFSIDDAMEPQEDGRHIMIHGTATEQGVKELKLSKAQWLVDTETNYIKEARYWNAKGELAKELTYEDIQDHNGVRVAHRATAKNVMENRHTVFEVVEADVKSTMASRYFTLTGIERGL